MATIFGKGICQCEGFVTLSLTPDGLLMGSGPDALRDIASSVHHLNRNGKREDFLALAFPEFTPQKGFQAVGSAIDVFGSKERLADLVDNDRIRSLQRRGLVFPVRRIKSVSVSVGEIGTAFVRVRHNERRTPAEVERAKRRAERRGVVLSQHYVARPSKKSSCNSIFIKYEGGAYVEVKPVTMPVTSSLVEVSTYGFSSLSAGAALPIVLPVGPMVNYGAAA